MTGDEEEAGEKAFVLVDVPIMGQKCGPGQTDRSPFNRADVHHRALLFWSSQHLHADVWLRLSKDTLTRRASAPSVGFASLHSE